jgi:hypothetical protein
VQVLANEAIRLDIPIFNHMAAIRIPVQPEPPRRVCDVLVVRPKHRPKKIHCRTVTGWSRRFPARGRKGRQGSAGCRFSGDGKVELFFCYYDPGLLTITTRIHRLRLSGLGHEGSFVARLREQQYFSRNSIFCYFND